ncbi:hypothetical protein [Pararhizobium gei]|uniref:hypothetical protein n=1 Tax=Pararhizobium gei TaxID=1395951 RepID=UPI0023DC519F|nr:hypothetical protein [Rhizobium gei]
MTNVLTFPIEASRGVTPAAASQKTSEHKYRVMTDALGFLRDQLFELTMELECSCTQLTVVAAANSLASAVEEESRRNACSRSPLNP